MMTDTEFYGLLLIASGIFGWGVAMVYENLRVHRALLDQETQAIDEELSDG